MNNDLCESIVNHANQIFQSIANLNGMLNENGSISNLYVNYFNSKLKLYIIQHVTNIRTSIHYVLTIYCICITINILSIKITSYAKGQYITLTE